jgi:perosamine synthetase
VHLYGHPADMDANNHVAGEHGQWDVEDAAEAHGARYKRRATGTLAPVATFSFYGNKILTSGEGGALTVSEERMELRMRTLRGQGMDPQRRYYFPVTGYNFRLTNLACAILCAQLERSEQILARRREIFAIYREALADVPGVGFQPVAPWAEAAPWLFCVTIEKESFGRSRDDLMATLADEGIETRPFFLPLHGLPPFREQSLKRGELLPITDRIAASGINLPTYTGMSDADVLRVAGCVRRARRAAARVMKKKAA